MATDCSRLRGRVGLLVLLVLAATGASAHASPGLLSQGFEGGADGWTATGMWHVQADPQRIVVSPAISGRLVTLPDAGFLPAAARGSAVAWFGDPSTGTYCGADFATVRQTPRDGCTSSARETGTLTSPDFSLAEQVPAFVSYDAWWEIEAQNADVADQMRVEYTIDDGASWHSAEFLNPIAPAWGGGHQSFGDAGVRARPVWQHHVAALAGAAGAPHVQLRFVFDSVDNRRNGFRGLLIDDVELVNEFGDVIEQPLATPGSPQAPLGIVPLPPPLLQPQANGGGAMLLPSLGRTFRLTYVSGLVRYHEPGKRYIGLSAGDVLLPLGSVVDTTKGRARVAVQRDPGGTIDSGEFYAGAFGVFQGAAAVMTADIVMAGGDFRSCSRRAARASARRRPVRRLWGTALGRFRTKGRYASATIRGTRWLTEDFCSATRLAVRSGIVSVLDFRRKRTRTVRAGHSITISALDGPRYRRRTGTHAPRLR